MDTTEKILLILGGVIAGAVIIFILTRPSASPASQYVVRSYHNLEEWHFIKDPEGRVTGVSVKRSAEEN